MLKGVTKRTIEIRSPDSRYFEGALLFVRPSAVKSTKLCRHEAEKYLCDISDSFAGGKLKRMQTLVAALLVALGVCMAAFLAVLILYTKTLL